MSTMSPQVPMLGCPISCELRICRRGVGDSDDSACDVGNPDDRVRLFVIEASDPELQSDQIGQGEHHLPVKPVMQESCLAVVGRVVR